MEIGLFTIGERTPGPEGSPPETEQERLLRLVRIVRHAEDVGFDVIAVGEHHNPPFVTSSQAAILGYLASATSKIRLSTATTLITTNDPVRLAEEFATLQLLSEDRVDLMLGKGNTPQVFGWFGREDVDPTALADENYALLRELWDKDRVDWTGRFRAPLRGFTAIPRPLDSGAPFVWHGAVTGVESADRAARYGDGYFVNNLFAPISHFSRMISAFRERWQSNGRAAADARIGAGGILFVRPDSQRARHEFAPHYAANSALSRSGAFDQAIRSTGLVVGSPAEAIDRILSLREHFGGYQRQLFNVDLASLPEATVHQVIDLVGSQVLPFLKNNAPQRSVHAAA